MSKSIFLIVLFCIAHINITETHAMPNADHVAYAPNTTLHTRCDGTPLPRILPGTCNINPARSVCESPHSCISCSSKDTKIKSQRNSDHVKIPININEEKISQQSTKTHEFEHSADVTCQHNTDAQANCNINKCLHAAPQMPKFLHAAVLRMPNNLEWAFTRCGQIKQHDFYIDDSNEGQGTHYHYPSDDIYAMIRGWTFRVQSFNASRAVWDRQAIGIDADVAAVDDVAVAADADGVDIADDADAVVEMGDTASAGVTADNFFEIDAAAVNADVAAAVGTTGKVGGGAPTDPTGVTRTNNATENNGSAAIRGGIYMSNKIESARNKKRVSPSPRLNLEYLLEALMRYSVKDKTVLVYGSMSPEIESLCLALGAKHVTTVEYNKLTYEHPQMTTITVEEWTAFSRPRNDNSTVHDSNVPKFDVVLSISSFDHDGLGRYGDPLCPNADLMAVDAVRKHVGTNGMFLLTVPVGRDAVVWNLHRRYGAIRLPLLLANWDVKDYVGHPGESLQDVIRGSAYDDTPFMKSYEPVLVLVRSLQN